MTYDKSSEFQGTLTAFNLEMIRSLQGMDTMYPIFAAFNKWLRKINGSKDTIGDVREQNNQIFNTFVFLMNHNYLFYLIVTNQFAQINQLYAVHGLHLKNPKLLEQISREYQQAVQNQFILDLKDNIPLDNMHLRKIDEGYFVISDSTAYNLFADLSKQYQKLNHACQVEQAQIVREIFENEVRQNITLIQEDETLPGPVKDEIISIHIQFEDELAQLEKELSDEEDNEEEEDLYSFDDYKLEAIFHLPGELPLDNVLVLEDVPALDMEETPVDEDLVEPLRIHVPIPAGEKEQNPDEVQISQNDLQPRERLPERVVSTDQPQSLNTGRSFDSLPMSQKIGAFEKGNATEGIPKLESLRRPPPSQRMTNLIDRFEERMSGLFVKHGKYDSIKIHEKRHRDSVFSMRQGVEAITRKYLPNLEHISRKQEMALVDIKVDLENFINLLSSNLSSLDGSDKNQLRKSIKNLKQYEENLLDAVEYEEVQSALKNHLTELETLTNLFTPPGALAAQQKQYEDLKISLQQSLVPKPSEPGSKITSSGEHAQTDSEPSSKPKVRKFAVGLARSHLIQEQRHQVIRHGFFSQPQKPTPDQSQQLKITKHSRQELTSLTEDVAEKLREQIGLVKTQLGFLTKPGDPLEKANAIIKRIEETSYQKANPVDLSALANIVNTLIPDSSIGPELVELSVQVYDQSSSKSTHQG
jgi:hypothetical protein